MLAWLFQPKIDPATPVEEWLVVADKIGGRCSCYKTLIGVATWQQVKTKIIRNVPLPPNSFGPQNRIFYVLQVTSGRRRSFIYTETEFLAVYQIVPTL